MDNIIVLGLMFYLIFRVLSARDNSDVSPSGATLWVEQSQEIHQSGDHDHFYISICSLVLSVALIENSVMLRCPPHHFPLAVGGRVYFRSSAVYVKEKGRIASRPLIASQIWSTFDGHRPLH